MLDRSDDEIKERIWKIRKFITNLEEIKDEVLTFLESTKDLDEQAKKIWISDVKKMYFQTVAAWQLLNSYISNGKEKNVINSKSFLEGARSLSSQAISELAVFNEVEANKLIKSIETTFQQCYEAFKKEYDIVSPKKRPNEPIPKVIKVSEIHYRIPCAICGEIAVEFMIGRGSFDKEDRLVFVGLTHQRSLLKELSNEVFSLLNVEDIAGIHHFMRKYEYYEGLDAYCPECDKVYCWEHYRVREVFDEGFYDCSYGTCPLGHTRVIDD